jgi:hypothetical protein
VYEECEIDQLVDRRVVNEVVEHKAKWSHVEPGEDEYSWVTTEDASGAEGWKDAVDRFFLAKEDEPNLNFSEWIARDIEVTMVGNNGAHSCVYEAVREIVKMQGAEFELSDEIVAEYELVHNIDRTS